MYIYLSLHQKLQGVVPGIIQKLLCDMKSDYWKHYTSVFWPFSVKINVDDLGSTHNTKMPSFSRHCWQCYQFNCPINDIHSLWASATSHLYNMADKLNLWNFCCLFLFTAHVIIDRETRRSRGFGFVTFEDAKAFEKALLLDGTVMVILLCGKKLFSSFNVNFDFFPYRIQTLS